jgi:hypothetical protein
MIASRRLMRITTALGKITKIKKNRSLMIASRRLMRITTALGKKKKQVIDDCFKTPNAYYYRVGSESVIR